MAAESYNAENTFEQGLQADLPAVSTPATVYVDATNLHLYSGQGQELALKSEPGAVLLTQLSPGFIPGAQCVYNGVTYLYCLEVVNGEATGRAELGSFPAPAYTRAGQDSSENSVLLPSGAMQQQYAPLQNYYGDHDGASPGRFVSELFAAKQTMHLELHAQPSYDGSINLLLVDGENPVRLINTGFAVSSDGLGYTIPTRDGEADTNRYSYRDFESRLNLLQRSLSLPKVYLRGVTSGGQVLAGNWRYLFRYADADGNQTDVCCESSLVCVAQGDSPATMHGLLAGEKTTCRVELQLTDLDTSFGFLKVLAQYDSGMPESQAALYELDVTLSIPESGELLFTHSGYETTQAVSEQELSIRTSRIGAVRTLVQHEGITLLGGVQETSYDTAGLTALAASWKLGYEYQSLQLPGTENTTSAGDIYQPIVRVQATPVPFAQQRQQRYAGGYANPHNIYNRLGYWSGESYAFGVVFILQDGSLSDVFPLQGLDNVDNVQAQVPDTAPGFYDAQGWVTPAGSTGLNNGQNVAGVYRFPARNASSATPILGPGGVAQILAATVQVPVIPAEIRRKAVGVFFVRAPRTPNVVAQGVVVPTLRSLAVAPNGQRFDHVDPALDGIYAGSTSNLKVLPAVGGVLEAAVKKDNESDARGKLINVFPFGFTTRVTNNAGKNPYDPKRLAFYAPDLYARPASQRSRVHGRQVQLQPITTGFYRRSVQFDNAPGFGSWSLFKLTHYTNTIQSTSLSGQSWWTLGAQGLANNGQFGSFESHLRGKHKNDDFYLVHASFNDYVGIVANGSVTSLTDPLIPAYDTRQTGVELAYQHTGAINDPSRPTAMLANLYTDGGSGSSLGAGLWDTTVLRDIYRPDALSYTPISPRLSWDELEQSLDGQRRLALFGGDCFIGLHYRRLYTNVQPGEALDPAFAAAGVGQVLSICCESNLNPYTRAEDPASSEQPDKRSFVPLIGSASQNFQLYRDNSVYKVPEPQQYNAGYLWQPGAYVNLALPQGVPYRSRSYPSRVWATAKSQPGSFTNGARQLLPLAFQDYNPHLGAAVRLLNCSGRVALVQQHGVSWLPVNEQATTPAETGQPLVLAQGSILGPRAQVLSAEIGAQHGSAVEASDTTVYGIDETRRTTWKIAGEGLQLLDDMRVRRLLTPHWDVFTRYQPGLLTQQACVSIDQQRQDIVFTLYRRNDVEITEKPETEISAYTGTGNIQLLYSEKLDRWISRPTYRAQLQWSWQDKLVSFPLPELVNGPYKRLVPGLYAHRQNTQAHNAVYGRLTPGSVSFVVRGQDVDTQKILQNLLLVSGDTPAARLAIVADPDLPSHRAETTQALISQGSILQRNMRYKEGHWYVVVKKQQAGQGTGRVRGRTLQLTLHYTGTQPIALHRVLSAVQQSFS